MIRNHRPQPVFHGWIVVAAAFAMTFIGFGCAYTFSAFLDTLQTEFGAWRGSVSLVFSLAGFLYFGLGILSGPMADRWGARRVAAAGMALVGLGLVCASQARTLAQVYLAYGIGMGFGIGLSYVPALGVVQRWFVRRRGVASGLAVSGTGLGTLVMPPLAALLIRAIGWRETYLLFGVVAAALGIGMASLLRNDPRELGLGPDGDAPAPFARVALQPAAGSVLGLVGSRRFLWLYATCAAASIGLFVPFVHLTPFAMQQGIAPSAAVMLVGVIGIGSTAGRFLLGALADRADRQAVLTAMLAGMAMTLALWAGSGSRAALTVVAFCYGVFYGGFVAILPALVMDVFGGRHIGSLIGILYTSVAVGTLVGPSAVGHAFDLTHHYPVSIALCACTTAVAALMSSATGALIRAGRFKSVLSLPA